MNATGGQTEYPQFAASFPGYGSEWKREIKSRYVAQARVWNAGAEMLARKENFVELDPEVKDHWGIPVLKIHFTHGDNDYKLIEDFQQHAEELFRKAGGEVMPGAPRASARRPLGGSIHEVGTARMSVSSKDGVLTSFGQTHDIPNLYVFGGNAFPSTGDKHPTLTMMALSARGCDHLLETAKGRKV
jgi:choline dehydrogenase-like flavoprotein